MKTSFILALVLLVCETLAANTDYVKLDANTISKSQLIKDLRQLGAEYALEKGIFPEDALPNGYWIVYKTESVYKRVFNGATYYKYTVQLRCESDPILIRANYIVAIWASNANTLVTDYSYSVIDENPNIPVATDVPEYIDNRLLKQGSGDLWSLLDGGIKYTVKNAISKGLIKNSTYKFVRVYSIQDTGFSNPSGYNYLVQLVSKQGYNYRVRTTVWENNSTPKYVIYPNV